MVLSAHRVRTSLAIGAAGATVVSALLLTQRHLPPPAAPPHCDIAAVPAIPAVVATSVEAGEIRLLARLGTAQILGGAHDEDLAITIIAPADKHDARPPLSLAVVLDRSGSMDGPPLANAKAAATKLVEQLAETDAFSIVTFSSGDETVVQMGLATAAHKAEARAAIAHIYDDGGTCLSCGLERGARELSHSPIAGGLRRIVLISDGEANEGISDRKELAHLAASTARDGVSLSTVGVGLDFDEVTMTNLAEVGRGNYYFVADTAKLAEMFAHELGGLGSTIATDVRLTVSAPAGVELLAAYGYPALERAGSTVMVPIADLRAGETRKVVLHVRFAADSLGHAELATAALRWHQPADGAVRGASAIASVEVVTDADAVAASIDRDAASAIAEARSAQTLEDASAEYQRGGYEAARKVMDAQLPAQRARAQAAGNAGLVKELDDVSLDTLRSFEAAPASGAAGEQAKKATRASAYKMAR